MRALRPTELTWRYQPHDGTGAKQKWMVAGLQQSRPAEQDALNAAALCIGITVTFSAQDPAGRWAFQPSAPQAARSKPTVPGPLHPAPPPTQQISAKISTRYTTLATRFLQERSVWTSLCLDGNGLPTPLRPEIKQTSAQNCTVPACLLAQIQGTNRA